MRRRIFLLIVVSIFTTVIYGQNALVVDSIINKSKRERYQGSSYLDTITINGYKQVISKRALYRNFRSYVNSDVRTVILNGDTLQRSEAYQLIAKNYRDSIRAHKSVWGIVVAAPSYTPESSFGVGGGALFTFKMNRDIKNQYRSVIPFGFVASVNGTFSLSGSGEFFFKENQLRLQTEYTIRSEPTDFFGVGYNEIDNISQGEETTEYRQFQIGVRPTLLFEVANRLYVGAVLDYYYYKLSDINPTMAANSYYSRFDDSYLTAGAGVDIRYDTRDNTTMPYKGTYINLSSVIYGKGIGSSYNYTYTSIDYRGYKKLFNRRSVLAWCAQMDISTGDVPITNLPTFGGSNDMRGYEKGRYRDKTATWVIAEYRYMLGSDALYNATRPIYSRIGVAVWSGIASIGKGINHLDKFKVSYGVGLRYEVQPNNNFRLDIGASPNGGVLVYFNMMEAF